MKTNSKTKTAVITGGSSGLGLAFAELLARQGYKVNVIARNQQRLEEATNNLQAKGYDCIGLPGDVTNVTEMLQVAATVHEKCGKIDFLIANAGVVHVNLMEEMSYDEIKQDIEIDLWGAIVTAKSFLPFLNTPSKILFISSGFGLMGTAGYAAYCGAKAGVINFAEALRRELKHHGIAVHVACPSDIDTPQFHAETASMPTWMKVGSPPRVSAMPASVAAQKILRKCRGNRFLITITIDIWGLLLLTKLLPRQLRDWVLDMMFPRPSLKTS
jgi:short-subunit dehydrogenase